MPGAHGPIVVVEDDLSMRRAIERLLGAAGYSTAAFASAEALLEANGAGGAACLVLDIHLPGLSGFDLQRRLTETGTRRPVVFITAHDEPASRVQAGSLDAAAYLTKPVSGKVLLEAVLAVVGGPNADGSRAQARPEGSS